MSWAWDNGVAVVRNTSSDIHLLLYDDFQWGPAAFNFDLDEKPNNTLPRLLLRV